MNNKPISLYLNTLGSDKCSNHSYEFVYDDLFGQYDQSAEIDILESGVFEGASLCAWKEYFPNACVIGVDIVDHRLPAHIRNDIEFVLSDIKEYKPDRLFDVIIEDGNHSNFDAYWAGVNLPKLLKPNGTLIIEDVQEGYTVPFLLWGQLNGKYVVSTVDMRRITRGHDNFLIKIQPWPTTQK